MKPFAIALACLTCLALPTVGHAQTLSSAQISIANSTVDLIPSTSTSGILSGVRCNFVAATDVKIIFNLDGNTSSITLDPTNYERESSGAGQYLSGWIPMLSFFNTSIHVQLNNTGLGTSTINCWASWTQ